MPKRRNQAWTDSDDAVLVEEIEAAGFAQGSVAAGERLGRTANACGERYKVQRRLGLMPEVVNRRVIPDWQPAVSETDEAAWDRAKQVTGTDMKKHLTQHRATVTLPAEPCGLVFVSDQHIRQSGPVDLERMEADACLVRDTPGLYAILGGDGVDNHVKHTAAMRHGGSSPSEEWRLFNHYLGFFGDKILGVIAGNHDLFTSEMAGVDVLGMLMAERKLFYAKDEMVLDVRVGEQPYLVKVRHQYRYGSTFNLVHTVKRLWEMGSDDFDIGVVCHQHEAAIEPFEKHGRQVWGARPGSYQLTSSFTRRYGFNHARPTCPTFLLSAERREIQGFPDVGGAADYLTFQRSAAA